MGKAAEAGDYVVVVLSPAIVRFALHPGLEQLALEVLICAILRMLEGQVEEPPDVPLGLQVVSGLERAPGE